MLLRDLAPGVSLAQEPRAMEVEAEYGQGEALMIATGTRDPIERRASHFLLDAGAAVPPREGWA